MSNSYRAIKSTFLIFFSSLTIIFSNWAISQSEFSGSYKCTGEISNGLKKENGIVRHAKFRADSEFFVTHTSDFSDSVLDVWLSAWEASEEQMRWSYGKKREVVSDILFDEDKLSVGEGYRMETGSYWFRDASSNPLERLFWKECTVYRFQNNTQTQIACDIGYNELFQMNTASGEFTYAYLGSLHDPKSRDGYEGDDASVEHGTCKLYYP